jgi:hypothetical protein
MQLRGRGTATLVQGNMDRQRAVTPRSRRTNELAAHFLANGSDMPIAFASRASHRMRLQSLSQGRECQRMARIQVAGVGASAAAFVLLALPAGADTAGEIATRLAADPRLEPLVPIFEQCAERRASYPDDEAFYRSDYGAVCGSVMVSFGVVTDAELDAYWHQ